MNKSGIAPQVIAHPQGGGAIGGLGDAFTPDLHTGTGNLTVPIALPAGRNGFQPEISLQYATGFGNGPFGLGWHLGLPGVSRDSRNGVPRYDDDTDVFLLSGADQLVPAGVSDSAAALYRPRTEGAFARIERRLSEADDYWEIWSRGGLRSLYGHRGRRGSDTSVVGPPEPAGAAFSWSLTETTDTYGNRIEYVYARDPHAGAGGWRSNPVYPSAIKYADHGPRDSPQYLVTVHFVYEPRPDPFSAFRAGFEIRTTLRCARIEVRTHAGADRLARSIRLVYHDEGAAGGAANGMSLLRRIEVEGVDDARREPLPPLEFAYTPFDPSERRFVAIGAVADSLPPRSLGHPDFELADLFGRGLADVLEMGDARRYWTNLGGGTFDLPRALEALPAGVRLDASGTTLADMDGDGQIDVLVSGPVLNGYFPLTADSAAAGRPFVFAAGVQPFSLADPEVRLMDLDGDGVTDALRTGADFELYFHDRAAGWTRSERRARADFDHFPDVSFSDPRVKLADMNGDGLTDIVLLGGGHADYWPYMGHGRWGSRVRMGGHLDIGDAAVFGGVGFDPARLLLGDVDGDGLSDLVYVESGRVTIWLNQSGNRWSAPLVVHGTPPITDADSVRLADMLGQGSDGVLWTYDHRTFADGSYKFLDPVGGVKPYLLAERVNNAGARTRVTYASSTSFRIEDDRRPETRWRGRLPFPVQVVARVDSIDEISGATHTTEYRYHQGHWDGGEREFRGFGLVDQLETERFGAAGSRRSPPVLTRTWFHQGLVPSPEGVWHEPDIGPSTWTGDAPSFSPSLRTELTATANAAAAIGDFARLREAMRALRGTVLRTEVYALDGSAAQERPFTVTESLHDVREVLPGGAGRGRGSFFPFPIATRTTRWERGADPMTEFTFTGGYDEYGLPRTRLAVAVPRGRDPGATLEAASEPYLSTFSLTERARRVDGTTFIVDRGARATGYEVVNDGTPSVLDLRSSVLNGSSTLRLISHERHYFDGDAFVGLPLGQVGRFGATVRSESLAFTDDFLASTFDAGDPLAVGPRPPYLNGGSTAAWTPEYPAAFRAALPPLAGYVYDAGEAGGSPAGYYVTTRSHRYDFHDPAAVPRGMLRASRDPFGAEARVEHDAFDFMAVRATDALGLTTTAEYDYRVFQLRETTEPNGNSSAFTYSPAGYLTAQFLRGKHGEGDAANPTLRFEYDLLAFERNGRPIFARTIRRLHHDGEGGVAPEDRDATIETVEYSDGFGRLLQTRSRVEDTLFGDPAFGGSVLPVDQSGADAPVVGRTRAPGDPVNVVVSGAVVYDDKGRPIEKYEPYFDRGWDYSPPDLSRLGRKSRLFYDAAGRLVRTLNPDGSEQRAIFGVPPDLADPESYAPSPWEVFAYDAQDNAGRTHGQAASAFADHWDTPSSAVFDALGRTVSTTTRNGPNPAADWLTSRSTYDIQGNLVAVTDPLGRVAFRYAYDLMKRQWRADSIDAGRHDVVRDAVGHPVEARDSKGALALRAYDLAQRPLRVWARDDSPGAMTLRQRMEYGDGGRSDQPAGERATARSKNLLGQLTRHHDEAGLVETTAIDFKGNVLESSRRVLADGPLLAVLAGAAAAGWQIPVFSTDWEPGAPLTLADLEASLLESPYRASHSYDALNRVTELRLPTGVDGQRRSIRPIYNVSGHLEQVRLDDEVVVERVAYDAKGQRAMIAYGNGVLTRYAYDPQTFRLARLRSERWATNGVATYVPSGPAIQDCRYDYDLAGNILTIQDRAPGCGIPNNPDALSVGDPALAALLAGGDALVRRFTYDASYRLRSASGRECDLPPEGPPFADAPRCTDVTRARAYTETYHYDPAGNLVRLRHGHATGAAVRDFTVDSASNRLAAVETGQASFDYAFDACGNLRRETTSRQFDWDHADRMVVFRTQTAGAEPSVYARYLYDAAGRRVKKLVRRQDGSVHATNYVDSAFEHHRWTGGSGTGENNHVHVNDDTRRVALVRVGPAAPGDTAPPVQFQIPDHLGSATAVADATGVVISREEFTPFGETSFGTFARKRFRFCGMERDEESGLGHHGVRSYSPGLGRWVSADPAGLSGGGNLFAYAAGNPMRLVDASGMQPDAVDLPVDENGYYYIGEQTIEIHDAAPPMDPYEAARRAGTTNIVGLDEFERQRNFLRHPAGRPRTLYDDVAEAMWITDPEGASAAYYGELNAAYEDDRRPKEVELEKGWSRIDTAATLGKGIGLGVVILGGGGMGVVQAGGIVPFAKQIGWSMLLAGSTSEGGYSGCGLLAGMGALPGGGAAAAEAALAERAMARAVATQANVREVAGVTRTISPATGAERFSHITGGSGLSTPQSVAVEIAETRTLRLSPAGEGGHYGVGAYAYEGVRTSETFAMVHFSVPPGTAIERLTIPGQAPFVRLVPAEGSTLAIVNPVTNLTEAEIAAATELLQMLRKLL